MKRLPILILLLSAVLSCRKKDATQIIVDPGFGTYVSAFTTGVVSNQSTIKIILSEPNSEAVPGSPVKKEVLEFDPEIEGLTYWADEQTLEFRPNEKLPSGGKFIGSLFLGKLMDVPDEYRTMQFGFSVITQNLSVAYQGLLTPDASDYSKQEVLGTLSTNDFAESNAVRGCLTASQGGQPLHVEWQHDATGRVHNFSVKGVVRSEKEGQVDIAWTGASIDAASKGKKNIKIPSIHEFSVIQVTTVQDPALAFIVQFSDPLDPDQDLNGVIHLASGTPLRFAIDKNQVKAFPTGKVQGEETIVIESSARNTMDKPLGQRVEQRVHFNLEKPAIALLGSGVIMPSDAGAHFTFKAVNVKGVHLRVFRIFEDNVHQFMQVNHLDGNNELARVGRLVYDGTVDLNTTDSKSLGVWNNYSINLDRFVQPEPGAIYRVMMAFDRTQAVYPCSGTDLNDNEPLKKTAPQLDDGDHYYWSDFNWFEYDDYDWKHRDDPCYNAYYIDHDRGISANVFVSDFGIIAKEHSNNTLDAFVTDLRNTEPLSEVYVYAFNYQNIKVGEGRTSSSGHVRINCASKPYLLVANNGDQRGYLRVDNGSALSMSSFDISGIKTEQGIKAFLYGERGVWRPGDSIHMSLIIEDKLKTLPANHPVIVEFFDPLGKLYDKSVMTKGLHGMYHFTLKTESNDVTGNWRLKTTIGNSEFYKTIKIETIKPNRLHIDMNVAEVISATNTIAVPVGIKWLYGSPGSGIKVKSQMTVENMKTEFEKFKGYTFDDRSRSFSGGDLVEAEATTSADGASRLAFKWSSPKDAPGMLQLKFQTKAFESGGEFSQDFTSARYSPYKSYVGIQLSEGNSWMRSINTQLPSEIPIATVDEHGRGISRQLEVEVYEMGWNWWWESSGTDEITRYISRSSSQIIQTGTASTVNGKGIYTLKFPEPRWGKYLLRVLDPISGHSSSVIFYAHYPDWYNEGGTQQEAASMLSMEPSKPSYQVGESVSVAIPSGGIGRILVTIEKGDRILDQFWQDADKGNSNIVFQATPDMAPNVYVFAALLQPHGQVDNSLPLRMFGVAPVSIVDPSTKLEPVIKSPPTIQPEKPFTVTVSEKTGIPMTYSLAIVDEGLLGITRFKTPNPWNSFYAKEALNVRTWDMYKYVMDSKSGKLTPLLAVGGDEALVYKDEEKANRFKPVVRYLGPFYLESGQKSHTLQLPNYVGAVRVMVVAAQRGAYGMAEKQMEVNQPLMVLTTLPRILGPGEKLRLPVTAISMDEKIKTVQAKITVNGLLSVQEKVQTISFTTKGEKTIYFDVDVARKLGIAKVKVELIAGNEKAFDEAEIQVRPSNPPLSTSAFQVVEAGQSWTHDYQAKGIQGTNSAVIQVSSIPNLELEKHLNFLLQYPHGCIEQITSGAFPQLFLSQLTVLGEREKALIKTQVSSTLNRYRQYQLSSGAFGYWPGDRSEPSNWGTSYAGHFMLEAKKKGYELPAGMLDLWLKFQRKEAANWTRKATETWGHNDEDLAQAYRLFTLALAGEADLGAMNRLRQDDKLSEMAAWRLSAAYALVGREDVALQLADRPSSFEPYREQAFTYGSDVRDMAMVLQTLTYIDQNERAFELMTDISKSLHDEWHSTQTRAFALMAIGQFLGHKEAPESLKFTILINGKSQAVNQKSSLATFTIDKDHLKSGTITIENQNEEKLFVSLVQTGIPESFDERQRDDVEMTISYVDMKGAAIHPSKLKQGTDFKAIVRIKNPGARGRYDEMALTQIFPSGWQIINARVGSEAVSNSLSHQDYRDDRVYSYFDLNRGETKTIEVLLNATYAGRFYKPAMQCAPMYDESIKAIDPGQWVEVVAQ